MNPRLSPPRLPRTNHDFCRLHKNPCARSRVALRRAPRANGSHCCASLFICKNKPRIMDLYIGRRPYVQRITGKRSLRAVRMDCSIPYRSIGQLGTRCYCVSLLKYPDDPGGATGSASNPGPYTGRTKERPNWCRVSDRVTWDTWPHCPAPSPVWPVPP
jgi:hypothetical protein